MITRKSLRHPAFTLMELILVMTILAILSASVVLGWRQTQAHAEFKDYETRILSLIQKARGLSLSNLTITAADGSNIPVDYYHLAILKDGLLLEAVGADAGLTTELLDTIELGQNYYISNIVHVYYFPPFGEVCWRTDCSDPLITEKKFILRTQESNETQTITISTYGGYPELE